jgi:hypothetical protein
LVCSPAAVYFTFFTDPGYELQKYVSPVAFHVDWSVGTHEVKLGYDVSYGIPKISPYAKRWNNGETYYWKHISSDYKGWEKREGTEESYFGIYHKGETKYTAGKFSQTVGFRKIGIPANFGVDIYNDMWGDEGDRFETSRVRLNFNPLVSLENRLFTGESNPEFTADIEECVNNPTYIKNPNDPYAPDPNAYRAGILSLRVGPVSIGYDSENIRYVIQNVIVHNLSDSPYFRYMKKKKGRFYFQLGDW